MADKPAPGDELLAENPTEKYDQDFFLALAAKGKDAWNQWQRDPANKDVRVIFAGIDFSEAPWDQINFAGFEFGDGADFSGCKWRGVNWEEIEKDPKAFKPGRAYFARAAFGNGATFDGAAFGYCANFGGVAFGNGANFDGVAFGNVAIFDGAAFGDGARFIDVTFGAWASFDGAAFGDSANVGRAEFGSHASFRAAAFGDLAIFAGAAFGDLSTFTGASFGNGASFIGAVFGDGATFDGAAFGVGAHFDNTIFRGSAKFAGTSEEQCKRDLEGRVDGIWMDREALKVLRKRHEDSWMRFGSGPNRFTTISFANARFDGEAEFSGRTFEGSTDFTNTRFYSPPYFDTATDAAQIDITGARIGFGSPGSVGWVSAAKFVDRLRDSRKIAEEKRDHDRERDLYIEERKAELRIHLVQLFRGLKRARMGKWPLIAVALIDQLLWIAVMGVFWALADYGRSFVRPAVWLGLSGYVFYRLYLWILSPMMAKADPPDIDKYRQTVRMLALGNTVPFVGPLTIDAEIKKFLFCLHDTGCKAIPPEGYQFWVLAQNLLSIILIFFIGLALRNYFKIK
jgi:Pentapeptide repeats (9 copies)